MLRPYDDKRWELSEASIVEKMSWAAPRETMRFDDAAYSPLDIIGVHVPLRYCEGDRAFMRPQREIIKASEDQTIFSWGYKKGL